MFNVPSVKDAERQQQQQDRQASDLFPRSASTATRAPATSPARVPPIPRPSPPSPPSQPPRRHDLRPPAAVAATAAGVRLPPAVTPPPAAPTSLFPSSADFYRQNPQHTAQTGSVFTPAGTLPRAGPPGTSASAGAGASLVVDPRQRGNPLLERIQNVRWTFGDAYGADFLVGPTHGLLFLSLKYMRLFPAYLASRMEKIGAHRFTLRVLLAVVDVDDPNAAVRDLTRVALRAGWTLFLAWSPDEAARYLETFKAYEHKPPDLLKEKIDPGDHVALVVQVLTQIRSVTRADVVTLLSVFRSVAEILRAEPEDLAVLPGFGETKVRRVYEALHQPFYGAASSH